MKVDEFDSIIFDCDGVLIDVTTSYDTTINKTISYVLKEIADITADTPLTNEMLLKFKSTGGFNDEYQIGLTAPTPVTFRFHISAQASLTTIECGFTLINPEGDTMISIQPPFIQPLFSYN